MGDIFMFLNGITTGLRTIAMVNNRSQRYWRLEAVCLLRSMHWGDL